MIELYNKDCLEAMKSMQDNSFDLAIVDPPYGMKNTYGSANKAKKAEFDCSIKNHREWDIAPIPQYFKELKRVSKNQIVWGANHFIENIPNANSSCWIVWDKDNGHSHFADCELAYTSFNNAVRKISLRWNGMLQHDMKTKR